jgi:hypothetical protein
VGKKLRYEPIDVVESLEIGRGASGGLPFNIEGNCG